MNHQIPGSKLLLHNIWLKEQYEGHQNRLNTINNGTSEFSKIKPPVFKRAKEPSKFVTLEQKKVDYENNILVDSISSIFKSKGNNAEFQNKILPYHLKSNSNVKIPIKSLNKEFASREKEKIKEENSAIIDRIISKKSEFNLQKWKDDEKERQKFLNLKNDYSIKISKHASMKNLVDNSFKNKKKKNKTLTERLKKINPISSDDPLSNLISSQSSPTKAEKINHIINEKLKDLRKVVLYSNKNIMISNKNCKMEISQLQQRILISILDIENAKNYSMDIPFGKFNDIFAIANFSFKDFVSFIILSEFEMKLDIPKNMKISDTSNIISITRNQCLEHSKHEYSFEKKKKKIPTFKQLDPVMPKLSQKFKVKASNFL